MRKVLKSKVRLKAFLDIIAWERRRGEITLKENPDRLIPTAGELLAGLELAAELFSDVQDAAMGSAQGKDAAWQVVTWSELDGWPPQIQMVAKKEIDLLCRLDSWTTPEVEYQWIKVSDVARECPLVDRLSWVIAALLERHESLSEPAARRRLNQRIPRENERSNDMLDLIAYLCVEAGVSVTSYDRGGSHSIFEQLVNIARRYSGHSLPPESGTSRGWLRGYLTPEKRAQLAEYARALLDRRVAEAVAYMDDLRRSRRAIKGE